MGSLLAIICFLFALGFRYIGDKLGNIESIFGGVYTESMIFTMAGIIFFFVFSFFSTSISEEDQDDEFSQELDDNIEKISVYSKIKTYVINEKFTKFISNYIYVFGIILLYISLYILIVLVGDKDIFFYFLFLGAICLSILLAYKRNNFVLSLSSITSAFYFFIINISFVLAYFQKEYIISTGFWLSFILFLVIFFYCLFVLYNKQGDKKDPIIMFSLQMSLIFFLLIIPFIVNTILFGYSENSKYSYIYIGFIWSFIFLLGNNIKNLSSVFLVTLSFASIFYQYLLVFVSMYFILFYGVNSFLILIFVSSLWFLYIYKMHKIKETGCIGLILLLFSIFYSLYFVLNILSYDKIFVLLLYFLLFIVLEVLAQKVTLGIERKKIVYLHISIITLWFIFQCIHVFNYGWSLGYIASILIVTSALIFMSFYHMRNIRNEGY